MSDHIECTMCDLPITWDGGYEQWVHWENGAIYCPDKTASIIGLPDWIIQQEAADAADAERADDYARNEH